MSPWKPGPRWRNLSLALACGAFVSPLAADTFRIVELRDLVGDETETSLDRAIPTSSASLSHHVLYPAVRPTEGAAYLAPPANGGEPVWSVPQGDFRVAFRLPDDEPVDGAAYLRGNGGSALTKVTFRFDPADAEAVDEDAFEIVRRAHDARLAGSPLPGAAWFRHRAGDAPPAERDPTRELDSTFDLFSGGRAVAENLALDRELWLAEGDGGEPTALEDLDGVTVRAIDWSGMLEPGETEIDPLSRLIPHDQHAVFVPTLPGLFALLETLETEGTPILESYDVRSPYRHLPARYRRQMGLDVSEAIASKLPVTGVAITGGDPFFPTGTDVAVLFASDSPDTLFQALSATLAIKARLRGATKIESETGVGYQNPGRSFSAHLAKFDGAVAVANSPLQLQRLAGVAAGTTPALGTLEEFEFFRQRYPHGEPESAYVFLSDPTIRRWAGPRMRIAASRRTRAIAALGELTARRLDGAEPGDAFVGLLGETGIDESLVRSEIFGTLEFLTPVSELDFDTVTASEAAAYERWRTGYERGWGRAFDPIAIRLRLDDRRREMDLSVMPLTIGSDYREWIEVTGSDEPDPGATAAHPGARLFFSMAIDPEHSRLREMGAWTSEIIPGLKAEPLAWVGDSVSVFLDDEFFWKALEVGEVREIVETNFARLPLGVRIDSKSSVRLALFLAGLRGHIEQSAPDLLNWEQRKHGDTTYLALIPEEPGMGGLDDLEIYYAALKGSLLMALDEEVLQRAIDRARAGRPEGTGTHLNLAMNRVSPAVYGGIFGEGPRDRQRLVSWSAIPILNEWRRAFGTEAAADPVAWHERHFREEIHCPGGRGYRWNEGDRTMESVVFGHPGDPRGEAKPIGSIATFPRLRAGLTFEDDGLRVRATMERADSETPDSDPDVPGAAAEPEVPEGFPQPKDLIPTAPGGHWAYRESNSWSDESTTSESVIRETKPRGDAQVIELVTKSPLPDQEGSETMIDTYLLGDGYHLEASRGDWGSRAFSPPMPLLPAKLAPGLTFGREYRSILTDESGETREVHEFKGTVAGLETVTVPAGVFENCVRIDGVFHYFLAGRIGRFEDTTWYAPGVGAVKQIWEDGSDRGTEELESFEPAPNP